MDGAPLMMRSNDDHHGTQMPLASAVHTITETFTETPGFDLPSP